MEKIVKSFNVDKEIYQNFAMYCNVLEVSQSQTINDLLKTFIITHKADVIEKIIKIKNENN